MLSGAGHRRHRGSADPGIFTSWYLHLRSCGKGEVDEVKNRETREGDTEARANLMTELGYPSTVGKISQRLAWISADPSYVPLSPSKTVGWLAWSGSTSSAPTKRTQWSPESCASSSAPKSVDARSGG